MLTIKNRPAASLGVCALFLLVVLLAGCTPPGPRALLQGKKLIDQAKYAEAVAQLNTAATLLTNNAQAWNYLGIACHHAGQVAEAQTAYQRALALDHDLTEAHFNLGCLWLEQNKLDGAKSELLAFTLSRANSLDGLLKLGTAQSRSGELAAAEKTFSDALRLSPDHPEALNGLGVVRVQRRRPAEAAQYFNRALKHQPGYRPALLNSAIVSQQYLNEPQQALQKYREYVSLTPAPPATEAVKANVHLLEQQLAPKPEVVNPAPPPTTINPPRTVQTNGVHVASAPKSEPATNNVPKPAVATNVPRSMPVASVPKTNPTPTPTQTPVPNPPKPVEVVTPLPPPHTSHTDVVKVPAEPVVRVAQDSHPARTESAPATSAPPATTTPGASAPPTRASSPPASKPGLISRINPLNLFHSDSKSPRVTPLPPADTRRAEASKPTTTKAAPESTPPEVVFPRYTYPSLAKPVAGDRAAAMQPFSQGVQAHQAHRLTEAMQHYRAAALLDPAYYEACYNLGLAASESGNLQAALTAYENALAIRPDSVDARYQFALALKQSGYPADAAVELETILPASPKEVRAHLALGNLYAEQLRQPSKARLYYMKVLEEAPRHPQAGAIRLWLADHPR